MIVVDASVAVSWFFDDEDLAASQRAAERVLNESALVPPIFPAEVGNALIFASRRGRIPKDEVDAALERIKQLPIRIESRGFDVMNEIRLASRYNLTLYDAMYLALADRHRLELLTLDRHLKTAALKVGLREPES